MRLRRPSSPDPFEWHAWFAWHPVFVPDGSYNGGTWVWFETVYRRYQPQWGVSGYEFCLPEAP